MNIVNIEKDTLYTTIKSQADWYNSEAKKHSKMNRALWLASSLISVTVAISANFSFQFHGVSSASLTAFFSIILPVVTGYTVLRSPEKLWILEISMRNKLRSLETKMFLEWERNHDLEREPYEDEYGAIMGEANKKWLEIKNAES